MTRSNSQRVVVINDGDAGVRQALTADLSKAGFTIVACSDGLSVLRHLAMGERADALVTGITRPGAVEHFCVTAEALHQRPDLPIVRLTARPSYKDPAWIAHTTRAVLDCIGIDHRMSAARPTGPSIGTPARESL